MSAAVPSSSRGGLCRALEQARSWGEPKPLLCPRPEPALPRGASEPSLSGSRGLTTGASASPAAPCRSDDPASMEAGLAELRRLFAAECTLGTSAPGFGVSPPVRSGAANGLVHDSLWRKEAPRACKASLRALHERAGPRCLSSCAGDFRLLMASPDQGLSLLAGAVESEDAASDDLMAPASFGLGRVSPIGRPASSRASPAPSAGWHPTHCASPEPADLFSY